jgi:hypothetical protein
MPEEPRDTEQLKLLVIGHYLGAALALAGLGFLALHFLLFRFVIDNARTIQQGGRSGGGPQEIERILPWIYGIGAAFLVSYAIANIVSARLIAARRARTFSILVAAFDCAHMPIGTVLGILTMLVLTRDSVRAAYRS